MALRSPRGDILSQPPLLVSLTLVLLLSPAFAHAMPPLVAAAYMNWNYPVVEEFQSPVGHPHNFAEAAAGEERGFTLIRGVQRWTPHRGVDLSNQRYGAVVRAPAAGVVIEAGRLSTWGNLVVIAHRIPGGEMVASVSAHLKNGSMQVRKGQRVEAGQIIGRVGSTGRATGPHLHFEFRKLGHVDPQTVNWNQAPVLNPLHIIGQQYADAMVPNQGIPEHWGWAYIQSVSGSQPREVGDPDALLSRTEFFSWAARATGARIDSRSSSSRVWSRLAILGLSDHLSGLSSIQTTIGPDEANKAIGTLVERGWLRGVSRGPRVGAIDLIRHDLAGPTPHNTSTSSGILAERLERPLTRAEGALLILAAQSQASPATANLLSQDD